MEGGVWTPALAVTPEVVGLLARAGGLELTSDRTEALVGAVQALLADDARLAALNLHVTRAAGPMWPDVTHD